MLKTFVFISKNSSTIITLSATKFEEAEELLFNLVRPEANDFYVEDEDGNDEQ